MTEDEIRAQREKCADCGGELQEINVFESGKNPAQRPLTYGAKGGTPNIWTGLIPIDGELMAFMCTSCARVAFYAAANDNR